MHASRPYSAWLLLVFLTLGGVVAPTVHQVQHAAPHPQANVSAQPEQRPLHSEIDHSYQDEPARTVSHRFNCLLCQTHLVFKPLRHPSAPTPQFAAAALDVTTRWFVASPHLDHALIRGPPRAG